MRERDFGTWYHSPYNRQMFRFNYGQQDFLYLGLPSDKKNCKEVKDQLVKAPSPLSHSVFRSSEAHCRTERHLSPHAQGLHERKRLKRDNQISPISRSSSMFPFPSKAYFEAKAYLLSAGTACHQPDIGNCHHLEPRQRI